MSESARALVLALALAVQLLPARAGTRMVRPTYARPEDIEAVVTRIVPAAGVAAIKAQNAVMISGDDSVLEEAALVIRELDQPGQVIELEIGLSGSTSSAEDTRGLSASVQRARARQPVETPPSELRSSRGASASNSAQSLVAMAGRPAEVIIGESVLVDGGPLAPPREIQTGKRIALDSLRVVEDGKGVEMDVMVENTTPGAGNVVSSGTRAKTSVRLMVGQTRTIAAHNDSTDGESSESGASGTDRDGGSGRVRRQKVRGTSAGSVTITLKGIR